MLSRRILPLFALLLLFQGTLAAAVYTGIGAEYRFHAHQALELVLEQSRLVSEGSDYRYDVTGFTAHTLESLTVTVLKLGYRFGSGF